MMKKNICIIENEDSFVVTIISFFVLIALIILFSIFIEFFPNVKNPILLCLVIFIFLLTTRLNSFLLSKKKEEKIYKELRKNSFKYLVFFISKITKNNSIILCNQFEVDNQGNIFIQTTEQSSPSDEIYIDKKKVLEGKYSKVINLEKSGKINLLKKGKILTSEELKTFIKTAGERNL